MKHLFVAFCTALFSAPEQTHCGSQDFLSVCLLLLMIMMFVVVVVVLLVVCLFVVVVVVGGGVCLVIFVFTVVF